MKKSFIYGTVLILLGLLIALGPKLLFKICGGGCSCCGDVPQCFWMSQAEIGMGFLISALGFCFFVFTDPKIHLGMLIGVFLSGIVALLIPLTLIGGCADAAMRCHRIAIPALVVESIVVVGFSFALMICTARKNPI